MKKQIKLSIGIPAFNEGKNIKKLLMSILRQKETDFSLHEIIVISDGSTDNTVSQIQKIYDKRINLISGNGRLGKSHRIGQILQVFSGDLLFLIDADILIQDRVLFSKVIKHNNFNKAGLVGLSTSPTETNRFFQKILNSGFKASSDISLSWNKGQNYLSFKGCFLGLSKSYAKEVKIDSGIVNNDAYLYFKAKSFGYNPVFYSGAQVNYNSPKNFKDYLTQSERFVNSKEEMEKVFKKDLSKEYKIPYYLYFKIISKSLFNNPVLFTSYLILKLSTLFTKKNQIVNTWDMAVSTK